MITMQIWRALKRPPIHHPLFRRVSLMQPATRSLTLGVPLRYLFIGMLFGFLCFSLLNHVDLVFAAIFFGPLAAAGLYMALHGTIAGLFWASRISSIIVREHESGRFDLLSASPYGAFSASWAVCTGCQYYDQTFNGVGAQRVWYTRVFFLVLLLVTTILSIADPRSIAGSVLDYLFAFVAVFAAAVVFYLDDMQSSVIGSLIGLIVPLFARSRSEARLAAVVSFLLLQVSSYLLFWLIAFIIVPPLSALLPPILQLLLPVEQVIVFFAVREGLARLLWRLNAVLLKGEVGDLHLLGKGGLLMC